MIKRTLCFIVLVLSLLTTQVVASEVSMPWLAINNNTNSCGIISSTGNLAENLEEEGWELIEKKVSPDETEDNCKELGYDYVNKIESSKKELNTMQKIINWIKRIFT